MVEFPERISFAETLELYGDRKPSAIEQPEVEKLEFDRSNVQQRMNEAAAAALQKYRELGKESEGIILNEPDRWKKRMPIEAVVVDEDVPLTFFILKSFSRDGGVDGEETERIAFNLVKGRIEGDSRDALYAQWQSSLKGGNFIGTCELVDQGTLFNLKDRETEPKFRGQGFASMLLAASESFIQQAATDSQENHTSYVDAAQLDVISWLYNKGYRPQEAQDEERLAEVLNPDESLSLGMKYYVFKDVPEDDRVLKTEHGEKPNKAAAYRIRFVKEIPPELSPTVTDLQVNIRKAVSDEI